MSFLLKASPRQYHWCLHSWKVWRRQVRVSSQLCCWLLSTPLHSTVSVLWPERSPEAPKKGCFIKWKFLLKNKKSWKVARLSSSSMFQDWMRFHDLPLNLKAGLAFGNIFYCPEDVSVLTSINIIDHLKYFWVLQCAGGIIPEFTGIFPQQMTCAVILRVTNAQPFGATVQIVSRARFYFHLTIFL